MDGNPGGPGKVDKGKKRARTAELEAMEREEADQRRKAAEQRRNEAVERTQAAFDAAETVARDAREAANAYAAALAELQALDVMDERFTRPRSAGPDNGFDRQFDERSDTPTGPVGNEDEAVSEEPSERDPNTQYSDDGVEEREDRQGASQ
jgi:hypothetical protein